VRLRPLLVALLLALLAGACGSDDGNAQQDGPGSRVDERATGLEVPWGIAWLPNRRILVSERTTGRILMLNRRGGRPREVMRIPGVDTQAGEGGLLGIAVSPRYRRNRYVYAYFTSADDNRIVRFRLGGRVRPVLTGIDRAFNHNGGRIAFGPDGMLYAGTGDAGDASSAQDRDDLNGKILRMRPNGRVPRDNPFPGSLVYSWGHRNVQGLAWDGEDRLWATEFGQNELDEVNLIQPGRNYGWPEVEGTGGGERFVDPLVTWSTSEASPSGAAIKGDRLYVAALRGERLWRVKLDGERTAGEPQSLYRSRFGRLRTVAIGPDGALWFTTSNTDGRGSPEDGDDRLLRVARP
jgi:glucose/arabinose dehydrogenase